MRTEGITAFDRWLNEVLRKQFDPARHEAVPDELLLLLRGDDQPAPLPA